MRRMTTGAPNVPSGCSFPPHELDPLDWRDQTDGGEQTDELIGETEELTFVRSDSRTDYPVQPRFRSEIRPVDNGPGLPVENKVYGNSDRRVSDWRSSCLPGAGEASKNRVRKISGATVATIV